MEDDVRRVGWEGVASIYRAHRVFAKGRNESRDVDGLMGGHLLEMTMSPARFIVLGESMQAGWKIWIWGQRILIREWRCIKDILGCIPEVSRVLEYEGDLGMKWNE